MTGTYTAIGAAALSAAGAGANAYSQNQNMRKQDSQSAQSIIQQGAINSKAESAVSQLNANIAKSNPNDATKQQTAAYLAAIQQANPTQSVVNPNVPGGSKRFTQAQAASKADVANYARSTAGNMAAVAAPNLQRIGEGNQIGNVASELGRYNDESAAEQGILKTQLAGDQANPWLTALSGVLSGAGSGLSTYSGYRKGVGSGMGGSNIPAESTGPVHG